MTPLTPGQGTSKIRGMNTDDSNRIPDGVTLHERDGSMFLTYKNVTPARFAGIALVGIFYLTCVAYCVSGRAPMSELPWATLVFVFPAYFAVGLFVNTICFSVDDKEIVIRRIPLPTWPTKRIPSDKIVGFYLEQIHQTSGDTYTLSAAVGDPKDPKKRGIKDFGRNREVAKFFLSLFSRRFKVPTRIIRGQV